MFLLKVSFTFIYWLRLLVEVSRLESGSIYLSDLVCRPSTCLWRSLPFSKSIFASQKLAISSPYAQSNLYILPPFILPLQSLNITAALHLVSGFLPGPTIPEPVQQAFTLVSLGCDQMAQHVGTTCVGLGSHSARFHCSVTVRSLFCDSLCLFTAMYTGMSKAFYHFSIWEWPRIISIRLFMVGWRKFYWKSGLGSFWIWIIVYLGLVSASFSLSLGSIQFCVNVIICCGPSTCLVWFKVGEGVFWN